MVNKTLNKHYKDKLITSWIDVKKEFDLIDHKYPLKYIDFLNLQPYKEVFIRLILKRWTVNIIFDKEEVLTKEIKKV